MIGFRPSQPNRRPVYSTSGQRVGFIQASPRGDVVTDERGCPIALILRYKKGCGPWATASPCGGTMMFPWGVR